MVRANLFSSSSGSSHSTPLGGDHAPRRDSVVVTFESHEEEGGDDMAMSSLGGSPAASGESPGGSPRVIETGDSGISVATTTTTDAESANRSKRWLQFKPTDLLSWRGRKQSPKSPSPDLKPPVSDAKGESLIERDDKVFTVSTKDANMLERIAQRAQDRSLRIRKPHEVRVH